ncbi:MAG: hypothetical protein ACT6XS_17000 [Phreatobacter sp.]|uniref:hypothetical protein n=1 Tax=Phreatobacter sp. TaxID=1966341 RepID=UPI004035E2DE
MKLIGRKLLWPFALAAHRWRRRRLWNEVVPVVWRTPGQIIHEDLANYDDLGRQHFTKDFVDEFAKSRDDVLGRVRRLSMFTMIASLYMFSDYLALNLDARMGGVTLRSVPGMREGLLLVTYAVGAYSAMLQHNVYLMESVISFAIEKAFPPSLKNIYLVKYFPHNPLIYYNPAMAGHLHPTRLTTRFGTFGAIFMLVVGAVAFSLYFAMNIIVAFDTIKLRRFGVYSDVLAVLLVMMGLAVLIFSIMSRCPFPFRDYSKVNRVQGWRSIDPQAASAANVELYRRLNEEDERAIRAGIRNPPPYYVAPVVQPRYWNPSPRRPVSGAIPAQSFKFHLNCGSRLDGLSSRHEATKSLIDYLVDAITGRDRFSEKG